MAAPEGDPDLGRSAAKPLDDVDPVDTLKYNSMPTAEHINERIEGVRRSLGMYRLLCILSEGATGVVLEAEHYTIGRKVALKTINPKGFERTGMGVRELTEQFLHEARVLGAIDHPNVVTIYDAGFARGGDMVVEVPYLCLRLVPNGDLSTWVSRHGVIEDQAAMALLAGCAHGLRAVHRAGFLHRDLKPGNVLIEDDWTPRLTDFSAATAKGLPPRPGLLVGTPGYLAPEHIRHGVSNEATDIYALGATVYYALTGKPPYQVAPEDLPIWAENETVSANPRQERKSIDKKLAAVVMKTLQPQAKNRYATVSDLIEDCEAILRGATPGHASGRRSSVFWDAK